MNLKYILYITINTINGKFYIGVHKTNPEVFDGYIGNGIYRQSEAIKNTPFHKAVKKYGYNNFKRTIIKIFPFNEQGYIDAYKLESILVNETLLKSKNCYNCVLGGFGSVNNDNLKKVYKFDLNGNYLRSFKSVKDAALSINPENIYNTIKSIRNNCLGISKSSFGYYWSYIKQFNYSNNNRKKISQYTLSGKFIKNYNSIEEAQFDLHLNSIAQAISKHYNCGGFQWRFYNGSTKDIAPLINERNKNKILPILMIDIKTGNIKKYSSIQECVIKNPQLKNTQINRVIKKIIKSHKGYYFKYDNDNIV